MRTDVRARGRWPGPVQLRRGWRSARARPWNDQTTDQAALRLERGSDRFLAGCVHWLAGAGVALTLSPALAQDQTGLWRRAGFRDHLYLDVFERDLTTLNPAPLHVTRPEKNPFLEELARIDDAAFDPTWRVGQGGLVDALSATPLSEALVVEDGGRVIGFAIVGVMSTVSYLQRVAVAPDQTRQGIGRSLVRACLEWARQRGARTMLLNTQPENAAAASLYRSEGFLPLGSRLSVLARETHSNGTA